MQRTFEPADQGAVLPVLTARTFTSMGTVISITTPAAAARAEPASGRKGITGPLDAAAAAVERVFAGLDARFSLYRPDSEAS